MACLYLSFKLCDFHVRLKDILLVLGKIFLGVDPLPEKDLDRWRDAIIFFEEYVLVTLCFDMDVQDIFPWFLETAQKIRGTCMSVYVFLTRSVSRTLTDCLGFNE